MGLVLLGIGAMASPRYAPAGLLVERRGCRVMLDGGPGAAPRARRTPGWSRTSRASAVNTWPLSELPA